MQQIIAVVLAVSAASSAVAQQATRPDPADMKAPVPALRYESAFKDYRPYVDPQIARWRDLNEEAGRLGGHMGHVAKPGEKGKAASKTAPPQEHGGHK